MLLELKLNIFYSHMKMLSPMSCVLVVACPMLGCLAHAVLVLEMPIHCHMLVNVAHDAPEREHGSFVPQRHFMYHGKMIS